MDGAEVPFEHVDETKVKLAMIRAQFRCLVPETLASQEIFVLTGEKAPHGTESRD
jgi:hypothetical protein